MALIIARLAGDRSLTRATARENGARIALRAAKVWDVRLIVQILNCIEKFLDLNQVVFIFVLM